MEIYYDLDGLPMSWDQWAEMWTRKNAARSKDADGHSRPEDDPTRIGEDEIGEALVSTVWLGMDHGYGGGPPIIFETMIFGGEHDQFRERYCTKESALANHNRIVAALRAGESPELQ